MTELKTLKDFRDEKDGEHYNCVNIWELKAEAIKWVKAEDILTNSARVMFKIFFNLTEEDLK